ncbi:hypothetical protein GCM10009616_35060 [Microlunatus lacustris]
MVEGLGAWALVVGCPEDVAGLPVEVLAAAAGVLADLEVRDGLIAWLTPGTVPLKFFSPVLLEVLRTVPAPWRDGGPCARTCRTVMRRRR